MSILEAIEAFNVVRNAYKVARLSNFVENICVVFCSQIALAYGSCNFENFQNTTRAHKSRNALAFIRFPIRIISYFQNINLYPRL